MMWTMLESTESVLKMSAIIVIEGIRKGSGPQNYTFKSDADPFDQEAQLARQIYRGGV